jgi:hypothetical protein
MSSDTNYLRLTRNSRGLGTYSSLWTASDHLLLVTATGVSESYQRFYFRDIQYFATCKSRRFMVYNIVSAALLLISAAGTGVAYWSTNFIPPPLPVLAVVALVVLVLNLILGPTCNVTVTTGVQTVRLAPLSRHRRTRKAMERLLKRIETAQFALTPPEATPSQPQPGAQSASTESPLPPAASPVPGDQAADTAPRPTSDQSAG